VPQPTLEAAWRGLDAVLAGHTHGGQVRLPGGRALTTRTPLGPYYDRGVFDFAAPNARGWTRLYLNSGVGTSVLPVRFLCPPRYAVVEVGGAGVSSEEEPHRPRRAP
jgi:predicted MPP superfamily phosphohydrolase